MQLARQTRSFASGFRLLSSRVSCDSPLRPAGTTKLDPEEIEVGKDALLNPVVAYAIQQLDPTNLLRHY